MTRLNQSIRETIAWAAVEHTFDPRHEVILLAEDTLAREAHAFLLPADEIKAASKLPERWIVRKGCLRVNAAGYIVRLCVKGDGLPVPAGSQYGGVLGDIPHGDLADRIQAHATAKDALKTERQAAFRQVETMLRQVATIKRLKEVWPEGEPFYAAYIEAGSTTLPALRVDEINAMLGIAA